MNTLVNLEMERLVLAGVIDVAGVDGVEEAKGLVDRAGIRPEHFGFAAHLDVYAAVQTLLAQKRAPTLEAVGHLAKASKAVVTAGGAKWLANLALGGKAEMPHMLSQHAEVLRELALLRQIRAFLASGAERASVPGASPASLMADVRRFAETTSGSVAEQRTCAEDTFALFERMEAFASGKRETVIPTGIDALDEEIGGLRPTLTVLGGLPGAGKSALVATMLGNLAERGVRCGLFGLEDGTQWVTDRLVSREARVALADLDRRRFHEHEQEALQTAMGRVQHWMSHVEKCAPVGRMKPADLVARAKDWVLNRGVKAIFVDHIGELDHGGNRERHDLSVGDSLSELRRIAIDHNVPVVAVAHLRRDYEAKARGGDGKPMLSHFAESAYIERMARLALGVWAGPNDDTMHVSILKFTSGKAGTTLALPRITKAALVSPVGGRAVDLSAPKEQQ